MGGFNEQTHLSRITVTRKLGKCQHNKKGDGSSHHRSSMMGQGEPLSYESQTRCLTWHQQITSHFSPCSVLESVIWPGDFLD